MAHHYPDPKPLFRYTIGRKLFRALDFLCYAWPTAVLGIVLALVMMDGQ